MAATPLPFTATTVGNILGIELFDACVNFYRDIPGLQTWFEKENLLYLHFGDG